MTSARVMLEERARELVDRLGLDFDAALEMCLEDDSAKDAAATSQLAAELGVSTAEARALLLENDRAATSEALALALHERQMSETRLKISLNSPKPRRKSHPKIRRMTPPRMTTMTMRLMTAKMPTTTMMTMRKSMRNPLRRYTP